MNENPFAQFRAISRNPTQSGNPFAQFRKQATPQQQPTFEGQTVNTADKGDMGMEPGEVSPMTYAQDAARSFGSGLRSGVETLAGTAGDIQEMGGDAAGWVAGKLGASQGTQDMVRGAAQMAALGPIGLHGRQAFPRTSQIQNTTNQTIGSRYEPQTTGGKYARTVGEFAPAAAAGPGGVLRKTAMTVVPAAASELAGQAAEGSDFEPLARAGAATIAAIATGGRGNSTKTIAKGAPSQERVKDLTNKTYRELREADIVYDSNAFGRYMGFLSRKLKSEGISAADAPRTASLIDELDGMVNGRIDYSNFESIRKRAARTAREADSTDRAASSMVLQALDRFAESAPVATNGKVAPDVVNKMQKQARELAQRGIIARDIDDMMEKANTYQSGQQAGVRNQFTNYLRSKKGVRLKKQDPEMYKAMFEAAKGTPLSNLASTFGRFGIDIGNMGNIATLIPSAGAGAAYAYTGDPTIAAGVLAAGTAAKYGGRKMTVAQANRAKQVALAGREARKSVGQSVSTRNRGTVAGASIAANQSGSESRGSKNIPSGAVAIDADGNFLDASGKRLASR